MTLEFYFSCYEILRHTRVDTQIFRMFSIGEDWILCYKFDVSGNDFYRKSIWSLHFEPSYDIVGFKEQVKIY